MGAYVCRKPAYSQIRNTEKQFCLNFEGQGVITFEGGLELRLSGNHRLHPSNLYSPSGHQTSLQFRVPNQSHQATTQGSGSPGTVSGLWSASHDPSTCRPHTLPRRRRREVTSLSPVFFDSGHPQVHEPSRLKPPPYSGGRGSSSPRPSHAAFPQG